MHKSPIPQRAILLVRISDARDGDTAGVERQETDGRALAARLGWTIADVIVENDTSAFKRRRVKLADGRTELRVYRPGFRRALDLLAHGANDGFIAYDLDRTARDPRDLEDLIDVVEDSTPRVPVVSVTGSLDLSNDAGITMARVMVAVANKSSRDTQRRVKRAVEDLAKTGGHGGGVRRFGWEKDGVTERPSEVEAIREAARRVIAGESARAICRDFDNRGIRPVKATGWNVQTLIGCLRSPRVAGKRVYRGEVVGDAVWAPILDEDTWTEVCAVLGARGVGNSQALRFWAAGLLFCGKCDHAMGAKHMGKSWTYVCGARDSGRAHPTRGCSRTINGPGAEGEIARQVLAYLSRADVIEALGAASSGDGTAETRRMLADDENQLRELARAHGQKLISMAEWLEARAPIDERVRRYRDSLKAVVPAEARRVIESDDIPAAWEALEPTDKRDLARVVLAIGFFKGWTVEPAAPKGPRRFDATRMHLAKLDSN